MYVNLLARFSKKFPRNERLEIIFQNFVYRKLIYTDFNVHISQISQSCIFLSMIISLSFIIYTNIIALSPFFMIFAVIIFFFFYQTLFDSFKRYYLKKNQQIELIMPIIRNFIELYTSFLPEDYDFCTSFINLMCEIPSLLKNEFIQIRKRVQFGDNPEKLLFRYKTSSKKFRDFIDLLLLTNFKPNFKNLKSIESIEDKFEQHTKSVENRISIIFFLGLFFPIGISFVVILQILSGFATFFLIPLHFLLLKYITKTLLNDSNLLLGTSNSMNIDEKLEYRDLLEFFHIFSINLMNFNPEQAIFNSYERSPIRLKMKIKSIVNKLRTYKLSLEFFFIKFASTIENKKGKFLCQSILKMIINNSYYTSDQLLKIITVFKRHQKLERDRANIVKAEMIKVKIFNWILPIITGSLCAVFFTIIKLFSEFDWQLQIINLPFLRTVTPIYEAISFVFTQLVMILITNYYFIKIVRKRVNISSFIIVTLIFILTFLFSQSLLTAPIFEFM